MTNNINIHFEVEVEGLNQWFNNFNDARDEYYVLKECGFNPSLSRVAEGEQVVYWIDKACCFIG